MYLDGINRKLLNLMQAEFPLTKEPYSELGLKLGIDSDEVIHRIDQLKAKDVIRRISPILDARRLGYQTTLVAMRIAEGQLDKAKQVIIGHPGVSHGYERDHAFNIWITLAISQKSDIEAELKQLASAVGAEAIIALPAIKLFKLRVYFDMDGDNQSEADTGTETSLLPEMAELSQTDRLVINELQQDLCLVPTPFTTLAAQLGMNEEYFLAQCQSLLQRGIMRRFGASVNHRRAGFTANAMTCWVAPPDTVDVAGRKLASLREVSHCYERKTHPMWPYNLFAMIHGHSRGVCREVADKVSRETGIRDYVLLYSTREFKKVRIKYLV